MHTAIMPAAHPRNDSSQLTSNGIGGWDGGGGTGMCEYLSLGTGFDNDGNLMADFSNPDKLGKDTVTWRLINSTGKTILVAQYSFRVLETTFQPLATPPS